MMKLMRKANAIQVRSIRTTLRKFCKTKQCKESLLKSLISERNAKDKLSFSEERQREKLNELDGYPTPPMDEKLN